VIGACRRAGARLVYTSSASVVFEGRDLVGVDESLPYARRPLNHYCASKAEAERLVLASGGIALRPHLIWGPGERKLVPALLSLGARGWLAQVGPGRNRIDTAHVANVVHAHLLASDSREQGAFLITDGQSVGLWDWVRELLARLGLPPLKARLPLGLLWAAGWLCERLWLGEEPPLTRYLAAQLGVSHTSSIAAARTRLGYAPIVTREQGMDELLEHLKGHADPAPKRRSP
jgi:nucleoside-diphosphate-sugar epimerase